MLVPLLYGYRLVEKHKAHPQLKSLGVYYASLWAVAGVVWLLDQVFCEKLHSLRLDFIGVEIPNPQLHALWHLLTGFCTHVGMVKLYVIRQIVLHNQQLGITWVLGFWPTISHPSPKSQPTKVQKSNIPEQPVDRIKSS